MAKTRFPAEDEQEEAEYRCPFCRATMRPQSQPCRTMIGNVYFVWSAGGTAGGYLYAIIRLLAASDGLDSPKGQAALLWFCVLTVLLVGFILFWWSLTIDWQKTCPECECRVC